MRVSIQSSARSGPRGAVHDRRVGTGQRLRGVVDRRGEGRHQLRTGVVAGRLGRRRGDGLDTRPVAGDEGVRRQRLLRARQPEHPHGAALDQHQVGDQHPDVPPGQHASGGRTRPSGSSCSQSSRARLCSSRASAAVGRLRTDPSSRTGTDGRRIGGYTQVTSSPVSRIETTQGVLARRGFNDAAAAVRILSEWDDDREYLLDLVADAADPDLALTGLDRLAEVIPDLMDRLAGSRELARHLVGVLGNSESLGRHLIAHPDHLDWLDGPVEPLTAEAIRAELLRSVGADPDDPLPVATDPVGDGLRLTYRGHLLRIAAWDVCDPEPIEVMPRVASALSDLADATLEAALAMGRAKVGPNGLKTRLAVVGLGKCGAQELNYVSDVDVLFVAEPVLDDDGAPLITSEQAVSVATRMAAELTRVCSAFTAAGTIWEVDSALRPEGKAGQLVRTLSSHRTYYERWAKTWEFQAMLKSRPSAGDLALAQDFVDMVAPMVWRAAERENFVADTQAMRKRVIAHIPARDAGREIKLGAGGLRDVEFSVQLLQLVHGRVDERLRDRATLRRAEGPDRQRVRGSRRRQGLRAGVPVHAHARAPHPAVPPAADPRAARQRERSATARSLPRLRPAGRAGPGDLEALRPEGPSAARAAVLLPAAGRGRPDPHQGPAADRVLGAGPAQGPRLRRPQGRPPAHRRPQPGRHPAGRDPAAAAAGDARLVRHGAEPRPRSARVPPGLRHPRQHPVVSPGPPRRGHDGRAAGPDPRLQPVRGRAAATSAADHADAGRRRRAGAQVAGRPVRGDAGGGGTPHRPGQGRGVRPGHPPSRAVPDRGR